MIEPVNKTYRVLEVVENGERKFFPQERVMYFFWKKLVRDGFQCLKEEFDTLEQANECLYKRHTKDLKGKNADDEMRRKKKDDCTVGHPFDAVFYKLKQTNNE